MASMYQCYDCERKFGEPEYRSYIEYHPYGTGYAEEIFTYAVCPECGSEDIEEITEGDGDNDI